MCKALGFHLKSDGSVNTTHAIRHCDASEVITQRVSGAAAAASKLISESGLYKLIMRSDKANAKPFQDWVTKEVLPSIRKTGSFVTPSHAL